MENGVLRIAPSKGFVSLGLRDLWNYRDLVYFLTWRDIKVRYKQTALGAAWAILQPLGLMIVFTLLFSRMATVSTGNIPYPMFAYCGLLPWQLFAFALIESSNSLVVNERLVTKVYFPRLIIPLSTILAGIADFAIAFVVLLGMAFYYGFTITASILALPLFVLLAVLTAFGAGLWLSALNIQFRDVRYTLPFLSQFWLLATPVAYPTQFVPEKFRFLIGLNPMSSVVEGFRWALLGAGPGPNGLLGISTGIVLLMLVSGLWYFRRMERTFADVA